MSIDAAPRCVLTRLPPVAFYDRTRAHDLIERCPEGICYAPCLFVAPEYQNDAVSCEHITRATPCRKCGCAHLLG